ncbi:MAG: hypothetical protein OXR84_03490 [Magnetovibrio sp.]|nr:hypothetical protein [Magnetovibrio sp.]
MAGPVTITKEMAVTHADFFRSIVNAFEPGGYRREADRIVAEDGERRLEITLGPEGTRQIALLAVPATPVTLTFDGYSEAERAAAMERFDRAFQRGGG